MNQNVCRFTLNIDLCLKKWGGGEGKKGKKTPTDCLSISNLLRKQVFFFQLRNLKTYLESMDPSSHTLQI